MMSDPPRIGNRSGPEEMKMNERRILSHSFRGFSHTRSNDLRSSPGFTQLRLKVANAGVAPERLCHQNVRADFQRECQGPIQAFP